MENDFLLQSSVQYDFLLQYVDASWKFLDHRAAFRFQVGQLVAQDRVARYFP